MAGEVFAENFFSKYKKMLAKGGSHSIDSLINENECSLKSDELHDQHKKPSENK